MMRLVLALVLLIPCYGYAQCPTCVPSGKIRMMPKNQTYFSVKVQPVKPKYQRKGLIKRLLHR